MIIDSLTEASRYVSLHPLFEKALRYAADNYDTLEEGCYRLDGDRLKATVEVSEMRSHKDAVLEAHDRYIDIQLPLSGDESYGWRYRASCRDGRGYDKERDVEFFDDAPQDYFTVEPGQFVIFFPSDAHAPLVGRAGKIKKCVIKIRVE